MTIPERRPRSRKAAAYIFVALGTALLTIAILIPTYMVPRVKKIPLDISASTVSEATGSVLDADELKRTGRLVTATNVPLRAYVYVTAENPADGDIVTMQANTLLERTDRTDESKLVRASIDRVTIDRVTAQPQSEPTPTIQSEATGPAVAVPRDGFQYKLPFDTQKVSTYPYFDTIARTTTPLDYADDDRAIDGIQLYHSGSRSARSTWPKLRTTSSSRCRPLRSDYPATSRFGWICTTRSNVTCGLNPNPVRSSRRRSTSLGFWPDPRTTRPRLSPWT